MKTEAAPRLRADAATNLDRILLAALQVFSESGVDAGMDRIAARAEVGVGTLYRRFPSKDHLLEELVRSALDELLATAESALARPDGRGLEDFLFSVGRILAEHHGYAARIVQSQLFPQEKAAELRARVRRLTDQARQDGRLGAHVRVGDVHSVIWGLRGVIEATVKAAPRAWQRHLDLQLAGLRVMPAPTTHPALTSAQLAAVSGPSGAGATP